LTVESSARRQNRVLPEYRWNLTPKESHTVETTVSPIDSRKKWSILGVGQP